MASSWGCSLHVPCLHSFFFMPCSLWSGSAQTTLYSGTLVVVLSCFIPFLLSRPHSAWAFDSLWRMLSTRRWCRPFPTSGATPWGFSHAYMHSDSVHNPSFVSNMTSSVHLGHPSSSAWLSHLHSWESCLQGWRLASSFTYNWFPVPGRVLHMAVLSKYFLSEQSWFSVLFFSFMRLICMGFSSKSS